MATAPTPLPQASQPSGTQPDSSALLSTFSPTAEPGTSTSEWKVLLGTGAADAVGLAVDFGVKLTSQQQTDLLGFIAFLTAAASAYIVSRGIRKRGTLG